MNDWIIYTERGTMRCTRCEAEQEFPVRIYLNLVVPFMDAFLAEHANCHLKASVGGEAEPSRDQ